MWGGGVDAYLTGKRQPQRASQSNFMHHIFEDMKSTHL